MPKVVRVITRLNIGGPAQHAVLLTHLLARQGFPSLLVTGRVGPQEGDMSDLAARSGIVPVVIPALHNKAGLLANLDAGIHLYRLFRRERPAVVHLHMLKARGLGGIAARLARVPIVLETFHGTLFGEYYHPLVSRLLVWAERALGMLMDVVVTVSDAVADEVVRLRVAPRHKVRTIPLGLDIERFVEPHERGRFRAELGVGVAPLIGTVSRLVPIKGLEYLMHAVPRVLEHIPQARVAVVGDGPSRSSLERLAQRLGVHEQVRFMGWRRDLESVYADLDVVVLPSLNEGTPVSVIEALAAGRAVVATRVGGVPDVITDGVTGLLVPSRDAAALASQIVALLREPVLRQRLGEEGRRSVFPRFTAARLAADTAALYRSLLSHHEGRH